MPPGAQLRPRALPPLALSLLTLAILSGCGGDAGPEVRPARVLVVPEHPSVGVGQTVQMSATAFDDADHPLANTVARWQIGDATRASVSPSGLVTGVAVGSTSVSATIDGVAGSTEVSVTEPTPPLASVSVEPGELRVAPGRMARIVATLRDFNGEPFTGPTVTWTSDDPVVASVDAQGFVTGNVQGTTTVTASVEGLSSSAAVSVDRLFAVVSLAVTPPSANVTVNDTVRFTAVAADAQGGALPGRLVAWSIVTPDLATITADGLVKGARQGQTAVRAVADGFTAEAQLTVLPPLIGSLRAPARQAQGPGPAGR